MKKNSFFSKLTKCAALALVFGVVGGTGFSGVNYFMGDMIKGQEAEAEDTIQSAKIQPTSNVSSVSTKDISGVVEEAMPSVVAITSLTQQEVMSFFGRTQTYESEGSGSGIIVSRDDQYLYVATNNHVVENSSALTVQFFDDTTAPATLRGTDPADDLAVVQVAISDLSQETLNAVKVAAIGDSDQLSVGDAAIAIGNALGYGQSVTTGVISALGREVTFQDESTGETITSRLIQTDAAINPGNSGGALLNADGEVIGINSSKYSDTEVEGMGFAIPMATVKPIVEDLIANGKTTISGTPYLGIYGHDVAEEALKYYNMPKGVYVAQVIEGSGADTAGIMEGNIITKIDDTEIDSMDAMKKCVGEHKVGDTVVVTVQIADNGGYIEKQIPVTLTANSY